MSHTSKIESVTIVDVHALRAAVDELRTRQGVNLELKENIKPRAYYRDQQGMDQPAPYVVQLNDCKYDIGLYATEDGRGYEARYDTWAGEINGQLGAECREGENNSQAQAGKLFNLYAVHATMRAAAAQGQQVQRIDKENGEVELVVQLAA